MRLSLILSGVTAHVERISEGIKPSLATLAAATTTTVNVAVWTDEIKGWAALIAIVLSAPTALCVLIYWLFMVRRQWIDRNKA